MEIVGDYKIYCAQSDTTKQNSLQIIQFESEISTLKNDLPIYRTEERRLKEYDSQISADTSLWSCIEAAVICVIIW